MKVRLSSEKMIRWYENDPRTYTTINNLATTKGMIYVYKLNNTIILYIIQKLIWGKKRKHVLYLLIA